MHPDGSVQVDLAERMMFNCPDTYAASSYFLMDAPGRPREQGLGDRTVGHRDSKEKQGAEFTRLSST